MAQTRTKVALALAGGATALLVARAVMGASRAGPSTYPPLDTLKPLASDLWIVDSGPVRPGGVELPVRMTVVRLRSGGLWLHSPTRLSETLVTELGTLGAVEHLVAPNVAHWTFLTDWQQRFPGATTWAAPGLRDRAQVRASGLRLDHDLGEEPPAPWREQMDQGLLLGAGGFAEVYFFHRPSGTLMLTDVVQNLEPLRLPPLTRVFAYLSGSDAETTPRYLRGILKLKREQSEPAIQRMLALSPRRVTFAHGTWFERDASNRLKQALGWLTR